MMRFMPHPAVDLTGQRFGRLVALERSPRKGAAYWRCRAIVEQRRSRHQQFPAQGTLAPFMGPLRARAIEEFADDVAAGHNPINPHDPKEAASGPTSRSVGAGTSSRGSWARGSMSRHPQAGLLVATSKLLLPIRRAGSLQPGGDMTFSDAPRVPTSCSR